MDRAGRARRVVDGMPDAVVVTEDGRVTYANEVARRLFGGEPVGRRVEDLLVEVHTLPRFGGPAVPLVSRRGDGSIFHGDVRIASIEDGATVAIVREAPRPPTHDLSAREVEALTFAAQGLTNKAIAEAMFVSPHTVKNQLDRAIRKLGAHSKLEAVTVAVRDGIIVLGVALVVMEAIPLTG